MNDQILFTPSSLLDILSNVDELKDIDVGVTESNDGSIYLNIGQSSQKLDTSDATEVEVTDEILDVVEDANQDGYDNITEVKVERDDEVVESGIIKQVAKTLLVGGLVRLSAKLLGGGR